MLSGEELDRAFPFHIAVTQEMRVLHVGPSLARVEPELQAGSLADGVSFDRPAVPVELEAIRQSSNTVFVLRTRSGLRLRGQWLATSGQHLFVGSPMVHSLEELTAAGLSLADFAAHDPVTDYLFLLQTRDQALRDTRELHDQALRKQRALEEAHRSLLEQEALTQRAMRESQEKSSFLAGMSHELRTPLNAIIGYVELHLEEQEYGDVEHDLHKVLSSAQHLLSLINDVLDLARVESGRLRLRPVEIPLDGLIHEVLTTVHPLATRQGTTLVWPEQALPTICVDAVRLRQILLNLVVNAVRATPRGTVTLRVDQSADHEIGLEVDDTGVGMSAEVLSRLFRPYVQGPARTSAQRVGGTGLGLTMSRGLARLMGGDIEVTSTEGVGSTFRVRLPRGPAPPTRSARTEHKRSSTPEDGSPAAM